MNSTRGQNSIPALFALSGSPYCGNAQMTGRPLRADELFLVLDLARPGLAAVKAAVAKGDHPAASFTFHLLIVHTHW